MLKEELAQKLNNRQYGEEITEDEELIAEENGLVVVYGQSDDLVEFRGAIRDEIGAYEGTTIYLNEDRLLQNKCDNEDCPYFQKEIEKAKKIEALWSDEVDDAIWSFESQDITDVAKFNIYDDETLYCEGIVFDVADLV